MPQPTKSKSPFVTEADIYRALRDAKAECTASPCGSPSIKSDLRWFAAAPVNQKELILNLSRRLYAIRASRPDNALANLKRDLLKADRRALLDLCCLVAAIRLWRDHGQVQTQTKPRATTHPAVCKRTSLRYKIKVHLGEINDMRSKGYSWPRISQVLRQRWRKAFAGSKLDATYLRRTAAELNSQNDQMQK